MPGEDRDAFDAVQADMADHQRRFHGESTAESNRALAGEAMRQLDRKREEEKAAPAPEPLPPKPIETTTVRKEVNGREYLMRKEADTKPLLRKATVLEAEFLIRATERCQLLMSKPDTGPRGQASWRQRLLAVMQTKTKAASWQALADSPDDIATTRATCEKYQSQQKKHSHETNTQQTVDYARVKARELDQQYLAELLELLEASNPMFGDWKEPPRPRILG